MISFYSTADEISAAKPDTVILPIGSTEQHGPHLPVATDTLIASEIGERIAARLNAFLLPTLPISTCREHMGKKGSIWMNPDTFYHMIHDIVASLKEQGFRRIILVQGHGGIFVLGPAVREINAVNQDIRVIRLDPGMFAPAALLECSSNLHACEYETSLMLYMCEKHVRKDLIEDCIPDAAKDYLNYGSIFKYSKNGVWGAPSLASSDKGRKIMDSVIEESLNYIDTITNL